MSRFVSHRFIEEEEEEKKMTKVKIVPSNREVLIQRWQRQLIGRTHIHFHDVMLLLRQNVRLSFEY